MWKTTNYKGEVVTWYSEKDIKPFLDPYFKRLDFKTIAELAKKSIRITTYNRELEEKIEAYELESQEAKEIIAELEWKCKKLINELEEVRREYEEKKDEKNKQI